MTILITGGTGFIGAWIIRRLTAQGHAIRVLDIKDDRRVAQSIAGAAADEVEWRTGDIRDGKAVAQALDGCDGVIHLAAVLTPACRDSPVLGAEIVLIGTLNVFQAAKQHGLKQVVYASSAGVFGPHNGEIPWPITHYGAFKLATEGSARAYWHDEGIASVGFRPFVVYGPGRELGLTAGPTLACRAAAQGEAYTIPYTGLSDMLFVDDVAAAFEAAVTKRIEGAHAFNLLGELGTTADVVREIKRHVPDARIGAAGPPLPTHGEIAADPHVTGVLGALPRTSLADGVKATVAHYRQ